MGEPTSTRKALRRKICRELQMPFFKRFGANEQIVDTGSTATKIIDAALTQADGFWNGSWYFSVTNDDEASLIRNFSANDNSFNLETSLDSAPAAGDLYEIHSGWSAFEIHAAINRAIHMAERVYPNTVIDTSLIIQEDKLSYSIFALSVLPFSVHRVYIENPGSVMRGTATAGGAATITLESVPSEITTNWKISIYDGLGKGQIKNYVSHVGNVVTVAAWTTAPDSTSKYALWDATGEIYDWKPLYDWYPDAKEWPDEIRLRYRLTEYYGLRMRIEYIALHSDMTTDASTSTIPEEYLIPKACAILHGMRLNDTKSDRELHFAEMDRYEKQAESFMSRFAQHNPDAQLLNPERGYGYRLDDSDPLDWFGG